MPTRRHRRGMSLMELMVAIAIMLGLVVVLMPATSAMLGLRERKAARQIVVLYQQLHDEAALNNYTFRVIYDFTENRYEVETGLPGALIFDNPEDLERYHRELEEKKSLMDEEELAEWQQKRQPFERLRSRYDRKYELPGNIRILGVYTPQVGRMMTLDDLEDRAEDEDALQVTSYIFANGLMEHTLVWIGNPSNPDDTFTVEVEPLSGRVTMHPGLLDYRDSAQAVPTEGPSLPN